jgi:hypothetical protein
MAPGRKTGGRDFKKGKAPGPGRPKDTPEKKMARKALKDYYQQYLTNGEAVLDFKRLRTKDPGGAIDRAERACGNITSPEITIVMNRTQGGQSKQRRTITIETNDEDRV